MIEKTGAYLCNDVNNDFRFFWISSQRFQCTLEVFDRNVSRRLWRVGCCLLERWVNKLISDNYSYLIENR